MKGIRAYGAWEAQNARATGGGTTSKPPDTDGIVVTGSLLSLKNKFGISVTGLESFDCDMSAVPFSEREYFFYCL